MTRVFVDTYFYLAILNKDDAAHERAVELSMETRAACVTTEWVLTEVADAMARPSERHKFIRLLEQLRNTPLTTIVSATPELFARGVTLYGARMDKVWPLTDCISFEVMRELGITDALTGDHHFTQAGFRALF